MHVLFQHPCSDSCHLTVPYKLSFYFYYLLMLLFVETDYTFVEQLLLEQQWLGNCDIGELSSVMLDKPSCRGTY